MAEPTQHRQQALLDPPEAVSTVFHSLPYKPESQAGYSPTTGKIHDRKTKYNICKLSDQRHTSKQPWKAKGHLKEKKKPSMNINLKFREFAIFYQEAIIKLS